MPQQLSNEVVLSLHSLYQSVFSDLLVIVGLIIGFAGVLLPIGIAAIQARQQKREAALAREKIDAAVHDASQALRAELLVVQAATLTAFQERSDKVIADLRNEITVSFERGKAQTLHVQALTALGTKGYSLALTSACNAVPGYLSAKDHGNLRTVMSKIACVCLTKLDAATFDDEMKEAMSRAIDLLQDANETGQFTDLIRDLKKGESACRARETVAAG